MEILHTRNIGFLHDVCQVLICKTSKRESWINSFLVSGREEKDMELLDQALKSFSMVDPCWKILTYRYSQKGILLSRIFVDFVNENSDECYPKKFEEYISNYDFLKRKICDWYFEQEDIADTEIFREIIKKKSIEDSVKLCMYEFFAISDEYISKMIKSLRNIFSEMEVYYSYHTKYLVNIQEKFKYEDMKKEHELYSSNILWDQNIRYCEVSFSLINRYVVMWDKCDYTGKGWILLGTEYDVEIHRENINLVGFGNALGDSTRLKIIEEIHQNGEKTLTDICNRFGLVNAVVLYHLDILKKERILGQRHEGRRVYYWINYSRLKQAVLTLQTKFGGELYENMEKAAFVYGEQYPDE